MPGTAYQAFSDLFRQCARIQLFPPTLWRMEVWEVASAMGVGYEDPETEPQPAMAGAASPPQQGIGEVPTSEMDILRARLAAAQGLGEKPESKAMTAEEVAAMMNAMRPS